MKFLSACRTVATWCLSLVGCAPLAAHPAGRNTPIDLPALTAVVDAIVTEEALDRGVPGVAVAVVADGRCVVQRGYGWADLSPRRPVNAATPFHLASVTKPFTAAVVLQLAREGRVDLDERVARYLPALPGRYGEVTVRQLMTHTSGIARDLRTSNSDDPSREEYERRLREADRSAAPGVRWEYSNTGYTVLGWLVAAVEEQPLADVFRTRLFAPREMHQARYRVPLENDVERARPFKVVDGAAERETWVSGGFGSGGLTLSAHDMVAFAIGLQNGEVLTKFELDRAWAPARLGDGSPVGTRVMTDDDGYGLGWFLTEFEGERLVTHGGGIMGYSANLYHFPERALTIAVVANVKARDDGAAPVDSIARRIATAALSGELEHPSADARDAIEAAHRRFSRAFVAGDVAAVRRSYVEQPVALPPSGGAVTGIAAVSALLTSTNGQTLQRALYTERLEAHGSSAVELGTWFQEGQRDGKSFVASGRYLLTWVSTPTGWRIAGDAWQ